MGGSSSQTIGYRYFFSILRGLCRGPVDSIVQIDVADKQAWPATKSELAGYDDEGNPIYEDIPLSEPQTVSGDITIDAGNLFGGDKGEGGIKGTLNVLMGDANQTVHPRVQSILGGLVPAFRGVVTTFFDGLICSNNPYPKSWSWRVRRALRGWDDDTPWYPAKARIVMCGDIHAMNPAHIIYQCLTSKEWGRGLSASDWINEESFIAAANTLADECFGLCMTWNRTTPLDDFVGGVIDHIGAALYPARETGRMTIRLFRQDYDPESLPVFGYDTGLLEIAEDDGTTSEELRNEIMVKYMDPLIKDFRMVRVQNIAALQALGGTSSETIEYAGLPTADLALRIAQRDLRARGLPLRRFKLVFDRRGTPIEPGSVFRIADQDIGIANMVLRAGRVEDDTSGDGKITVVAVEDVFGLPNVSYIDPEPGETTPQDRNPRPALAYAAFEAPYANLVARMTPADLSYVQPEAGYVVTVGRSPTNFSIGFTALQAAGGAALADAGAGTFTPTGKVAPMTAASDTVVLTGGVSLLQLQEGEPLLIGNEIMGIEQITSSTDSTATVKVLRGCYDTVPTPHAENEPAWLFETFNHVSTTEYLEGETITTKMLTRTSSGVLDEADAPTMTTEMAARQYRPYPQGNLKIESNGAMTHFGLVTQIKGDLVMSWSARNRLTQADRLVGQSEGDIPAETDTEYRVRILDENDVEKLSRTYPISATGASIPESDLVAAGVSLSEFTLEVWSKRGAYDSLQRYRIPLEHTLA